MSVYKVWTNIDLRQRSASAAALFFWMAAPGAAASQAESCLPIETVELSGVSLLSVAERRALVAPFEGHCLGLADFDRILEEVTLAYVDAGYVLVRAYLPEQDLADGSLEIAVIEGELTGIAVNGQDDAPRRRWMGQVFPGQIGRPVHIRRIEQGLDQIKAMPRWDASFAFDPGELPGETVLAVEAESAKPIELTFSINNQGDDAATGGWIGAVSGDVSNLLGLNETLSFGATQSFTLRPFSFGSGTGDSSRSAYADLSLPYGDWTFGTGWAWSEYHLAIPGAIAPIPTDGTTQTFSFDVKRLLHRDQETKTYLSLELDRVASVNRIMGVQIDSSSRVLTSLRATLSHERTIWNGPFVGSLFVEKGLKLLGAEDAAAQPAGQPDAQYLLVGFSATYSHNIPVPKGRLVWSSTLNGQYSPDLLYGSQQYSVGGASDVRGTRIALASGSSGIFWRNELEYDLGEYFTDFPVAPKIYAGLDYGKVFAQSALGVSGGTALGSALGLRLENDAISFDASWQQVLAVSPGLQKPEGLVSVSLEWVF